MSHFSEDFLNADPDGLARLRDILHGRSAPAPDRPSLAVRFGAGPAATAPAGRATSPGSGRNLGRNLGKPLGQSSRGADKLGPSKDDPNRSGAKSSGKGARHLKGPGPDRCGSPKVTRKTLVTP
ncbi:hypothetical protein [Methylobacterium planeticum]|uniref:Uncharacterized protein n=1 Tax=Methylobacterium planeticum TaxID=2615211 RepID=A0A6N6MXV9_9HYPH|nr:hypothetical protein [Methylobacterium planeticum]KAB1075686.1 hypothetical protein F6X51_03165 [Methylobacterium planeticum]